MQRAYESDTFEIFERLSRLCLADRYVPKAAMFTRKSENLFEPPEIAWRISELRITFPDYQINKCGKEFLNFQQLRELYVQANIGYESLLPPEIGSLKSLETLTILNFEYSEFPKWILQLTNLSQLTFRGNSVSKIPEEIQKLSSLRLLRIENCGIEDLPKSTSELYKLRRLSLSDNQYLKSININSLPKNLEILNLAMTQVNNERLSEIKKQLPTLILNRFVD